MFGEHNIPLSCFPFTLLIPHVTTISSFYTNLSVHTLSAAFFFLCRHFLPCRNDFFAVLCRVCLSSSQHFLFSLALPFPAPLMLHLSVFLFSTFVGSRFRLSAPSSVPFPPQKKLRPGRQSRAVLLPESNVHSFASDGESLQTKPQAMQFTSGAELFRQFCFSKTAAKPAT